MVRKTYYIQSLKKFYKELTTLNNILADINPDEECTIYAAFMPLLAALGFTKQEDGTLKAPKVHSIWGLRAFSKRLIVLQDIEKYIEENDIDFCLGDFSDEEIENVLDIVANQTDYPNHVHQPDYIIQGAVAILADMLNEGIDDDEIGEDDEEEDETEPEEETKETKNDCSWSDVANVLEQVSKHLKDVGNALSDAIAE